MSPLLKLMHHFLEHCEEYGGLYTTLTQGISKSCPLSPLLGAIYLTPLDKAMENLPVKYIRYMDDWVIFAKTRWHLRKAIKITNQILASLKLQKHHDKTWIGRVAKTFDFCGFRFSEAGIIGLAKATRVKAISKLCKLYERGQTIEMEKYVKHFGAWVRGALGTCGTIECAPFRPGCTASRDTAYPGLIAIHPTLTSWDPSLP